MNFATYWLVPVIAAMIVGATSGAAHGPAHGAMMWAGTFSTCVVSIFLVHATLVLHQYLNRPKQLAFVWAR